jgi:hypothetical protein
MNDPKKLMNEVLPDPTRRAGQGTTRQRTVDRMTRLLAIAAASATIQSKCGGESGVGPGYGVVDPMPAPPSRCPGIAETIKATATWKPAGGGTGLEITLSKPGRADVRYDEKEAPVAYGFKVAGVTRKDGALTVLAAEPQPTVLVTVAVECAAGPAHVEVSVDTRGDKADGGAAIQVRVTDQY